MANTRSNKRSEEPLDLAELYCRKKEDPEFLVKKKINDLIGNT